MSLVFILVSVSALVMSVRGRAIETTTTTTTPVTKTAESTRSPSRVSLPLDSNPSTGSSALNDVDDVLLTVTASNKDDIVEECEKFARIVVNGKNRIEEAIATFGDRELFFDPEAVRRRISEAVARILNERSGNKLDKYFRCVEKLSG